jgi:hypothetical protein
VSDYPANSQTTNLSAHDQPNVHADFPGRLELVVRSGRSVFFAARDSCQHARNGSGISSAARRQEHHADPSERRLSVYAQAAISDQQFIFAGGFAGANNITGGT